MPSKTIGMYGAALLGSTAGGGGPPPLVPGILNFNFLTQAYYINGVLVALIDNMDDLWSIDANGMHVNDNFSGAPPKFIGPALAEFSRGNDNGFAIVMEINFIDGNGADFFWVRTVTPDISINHKKFSDGVIRASDLRDEYRQIDQSLPEDTGVVHRVGVMVSNAELTACYDNNSAVTSPDLPNPSFSMAVIDAVALVGFPDDTDPFGNIYVRKFELYEPKTPSELEALCAV